MRTFRYFKPNWGPGCVKHLCSYSHGDLQVLLLFLHLEDSWWEISWSWSAFWTDLQNRWRSLETWCACHCHTPYLMAQLHTHHFRLRVTPETFHHVFILGWIQASSSALEVALSQVSTVGCGLHLSVILKYRHKRPFMTILGSIWHHTSTQGLSHTGGTSTCCSKTWYTPATVCFSTCESEPLFLSATVPLVN